MESTSIIQLLQETTAIDDDLGSLKDIVQAGWPGQIQEVHLKYSLTGISVKRLPLKMDSP